MLVPPDMVGRFSLPSLGAGMPLNGGVSDLPAGAGQPITPRLRVLPMGFSWALHLCQGAHRRGISLGGFPASSLIEDGQPGRQARHGEPPVAAGYVGNSFVMGAEASSTGRHCDSVRCQLEKLGLVVHDREPASHDAEFLGLSLSEGRFLAVRPKCLWRLRLSIEKLLRVGKCSGLLMKVLLGHVTWSALLEREALRLLRASYAFAAKAGSQALALWRSVREELWRVRCLLHLLQADVLARWHGLVVASDASEFGLGLVRRRLPTDRVAELGRQSERWRLSSRGWFASP
jgi:hypothetical protein